MAENVNSNMERQVEILRAKRETLKLGAGKEKIDQHHHLGRFTARERLERLVDPGSFVEQYIFAETISSDFGMEKKRVPGDGVIVGHAEIAGQTVFVAANDGLVMGGSGASSHIRKLAKTIDLAAKMGRPYIQLTESSGGRIQEGLNVFSYAGSVFHSHTQASGVIPQICAIMGRCAGFGVYGPALMDFIFIVEDAGEMFITGPEVLREITGEKITLEKLGGAEVCMRINGVADFRVSNENECFEQIKRLLGFLPANCRELPPKIASTDDPERITAEVEDIVPAEPNRSYNMLKVITALVDNGEFMEVKMEWGPQHNCGVWSF